MPTENWIITARAEFAEPLGQLREMVRLRQELAQPVRMQVEIQQQASGLNRQTGAFEYPSAQGQPAGFVSGSGSQARSASSGEFVRLGESAVAQVLAEVRQGAYNALQRGAGGQIGSVSAAPSVLAAAPAMGVASPLSSGLVGTRAGATRAVNVFDPIYMQEDAAVASARATSAVSQPLARTGTGGPNEMMMGAATGVTSLATERAARRGGGGGGRGGGGTGGPTDMAPEWWLGGGGQEDEWAQFQVFNSRRRVEAARAAMQPVMAPTRGQRFMTGVTEGFQAGNMAAFNALMAGWAIGSSAMPIEQVNVPALQAAQQFRFDPSRGPSNQALTDARARYGLQAEGAQRQWDQGQTGFYNWMAGDNPLGLQLGGAAQNVNNALGSVTGFANAIQGPLLTGYLGVGAARGILSAAGVQGGISGAIQQAGSAIGSGVANAGTALGIGAGVGIGPVLATGAVGIGLQAGGEAIAGASGIPNAAQILRIVSAAMPGPMGDAARLFGGFQASGVGGMLGMGGQQQQAAAAAGPIGQGLPASMRQIITRQLEEAQLAADDPQRAAGIQEQLGRAQTGFGIAQSRYQLGVAREQMGISRRNFDQDQLIAGRRFEEDFQFAREDQGIGFGRQLRDIGIGGERARQDLGISLGRQREDLGISVGRQREDIGRGLGIQQREIGYSYGQNVEDINRSAAENQRDILLAPALTGMAGALIRNRIAQQRALAGAGRGRDRALGAAGRGAGDALGGVDIGAGRAGADIDRGAGRAGEDIGLGEGRATADATRGAADAADDLARGEGRARPRFEEDQARASQRFAVQEAIANREIAMREAILGLQEKFNNDLAGKQEDHVKLWDRATSRMEGAFDKMINEISGLFENLTPS